MFIASIAGLPAFLAYFATGLGLIGFYLVVYTFATAHDEFALIKERNVAAALSLGMSLLGFALPLASAFINSVTLVDAIIWGLIALIVQIIVYWLVKLAMRDLRVRIEAGDLSAALFLGFASLAAGIVNAASMVY